jgi:hypothetical protein
MNCENKNEVVATLDVLAKHGVLYGGTRLRRRMVARVRTSPTYIVVKYDDGGVQYIDRQRYLAVYLHRLVTKEVADALNALAECGLLYLDGKRVASVRRVGRRAEVALEDGRRLPSTRIRQLVIQLPP